MNLYFLNKENKQQLVATDANEESAIDLALNDLATRHPEMKSYYQRTWWDKYHRYWIDYGSHIEFYILQEEKYALNVVAETQEEKYALNVSVGPSCTKDYCELK